MKSADITWLALNSIEKAVYWWDGALAISSALKIVDFEWQLYFIVIVDAIALYKPVTLLNLYVIERKYNDQAKFMGHTHKYSLASEHASVKTTW